MSVCKTRQITYNSHPRISLFQRGKTDCPHLICTTGSPPNYSPSGIPVLRKTEMASDFHKFHICVQLEIEKINVLRIETKSLEKSGKQED